ncbi:MAG: tetratricopeptide repeat protein, partial [Nitrospira sp.]
LLGLIHHQRTEFAQAKLLLERVLAIHETILGPTDPKTAESLMNLARVLYADGEFTRASQLLDRSLQLRERALGKSHPDVGVTLMHLGIVRRAMGDLSAAGATADQAVAILQAAGAARRNDLAAALSVKGNILGRTGNYEAARPILQESLQLREQALGSDHPHTARSVIQLGMLEEKMGNYRSAKQLFERALTVNQTRLGLKNAEVAGNLNELGQVERLMGDLPSAKAHFQQALTIQEDTIGGKHPFVAVTLKELAEVARQQHDVITSQALLKRAMLIQEQSFGSNHPSLAETLTSLGYLHGSANDFSAAEGLFERAVRIREAALGPSHRDVAMSLLDLARAKHAQGQLVAARPLYERARRVVQSQQGLNPGLDDEALGRVWKNDLKGLQDYALLLAALASTASSSADQQSAIGDGFAISQLARGWLMQAAVARAVAQQAVSTTSAVVLAKRQEELRRKRQELWTRLSDLYGLANGQRSPTDLDTVKHALGDVQQELDRTSSELRTVAPRYAELAQPETVDIPQVQRLLQPGEALITFYSLADRLQIWLVHPGQEVRYHEAAISQTELLSLVQRIRSSLLPRAHAGSADLVPVAFDVATAARLYQLLFGAIVQQLQGVDNVIVVPDEVLLPLPFAALITEGTGQAFAELAQRYTQQRVPLARDLSAYASLPWLAKVYPLTVLPSTSALKLIRHERTRGDSPTEPLLGFGDPILGGQGRQRGGSMVATRGMRVTLDSIQALDRLPGTREELLAIAGVLGVNAETNLFLDRRASEPEVRRLNESGRLGRAKVIAFATHGLLAGEVHGLTQPALVLTPPAVVTEENDGLLSMEDVLQLKLPKTDLVILSACNTAGDNGSGESLSGLARAFFFAGAKGLLVSQWSVDDEATKTL